MKPDLEVDCIASVANLATVSADRARAMLDEVKVTAGDFAGAHAAAVWAVLEAMVRDGRQPDFYAVQPKCAGVPRELLVKMLVSTEGGSARERLVAVRDAGQRRRIVESLRSVAKLAASGSVPLSEAIAEAQRVLGSVASVEQTTRTADVEVMTFIDRLDEVQQGKREPVLPTGLEALDAFIGGLQPTLTVIGALAGVGKSALLAAIVRNLAKAGRRVGVFSLEDEASWLVRRLVSEASDVPVFVLAHKKLGHHQLARVQAAIEQAHADLSKVVVDDRPALTMSDIVASARNMLAVHRVEALLIDHLGEIRLERTDRHDLDIAEALQQLRALAKTYRVPVVVAAHLRRREGLTPESEPRLTDFAFSAAVERMARVALGLSRISDQPDMLRVTVLKQTQGAAGFSVDLQMCRTAGIVANASAPEARRAAAETYGSGE